MLHFTDRTKYFLNSHPTDMRKGCEGLANIVRTAMEHNPKNYDEAFIFYSKDYRKVKILHYDINGWVMYSKWFTDGKFLQPKFEECKKCHEISRHFLEIYSQLYDFIFFQVCLSSIQCLNIGSSIR